MEGKAQQLILDLPHRQALGREDFLVTSTNKEAVALIDQWPNWPGHAAIIVGPAGSGKSHLVEVWRQASGANLVHRLAFEDVPDAINNGALAIEDLHNTNTNIDERAIFHAINLAKQQNAKILFTSRMRPATQNFTIPDLASRLNAMPIVNILAPDDALLRGVLVKLFTDRQINVDEALISYLLLRMPRSLEAARTLVAETDRLAFEQKAEITKHFVAKVLNTMTSPDLFTTIE